MSTNCQVKNLFKEEAETVWEKLLPIRAYYFCPLASVEGETDLASNAGNTYG